MTSIRYVPGKVWGIYLLALAVGVVVLIILNTLWSRGGVLPGGIGALVAFVGMLTPGVIKRSSRTAPIVTIDARGITVDLPGFGTLPWETIRSAQITGSAWLAGRRLTILYAGTAPKSGLWDKLNWGVYTKQRGDLVQLRLGYIEQTDQPKSVIDAALSKAAAPAA
jgi:hypothetical protein